uniref:Uncharacterized protein n=1 Tax=Glossina pallidipes TaxID=7398 RepID=A0A1B0A1F4_GLOPL
MLSLIYQKDRAIVSRNAKIPQFGWGYVRDVRIFACISACSVSQTFRVSNNTSNVTCYFQCFANHKNLFGVLWLKECCLICRSSVTVAILPIPGYVDLTEGNLVC